jgi:3-oxoacyl-[acyl-carrier protein] reductase
MRTALVTGASRGIGAGIAARLAEQGYGLTITGRHTETLNPMAAALTATGSPRVVVVAGDMSRSDDLGPIIEAHAAEFSSMNALVLSAGVGTSGAIADFPLGRFDKSWAVNVRTPFLLIQRCLPMLRKAAVDDPTVAARIIAMASITGVYSEPTLAAYGATKAAVLSLVSTLNSEEARNGVSATALAPAFVDSDMTKWVQDTIPAEEMITINDLVEMVDTVLRLSRNTVISDIVVSRAHSTGYQA